MDLILWRHAEAEDGLPDMARPLTKRGQQQAKATARWLLSNIPEQTRIIVSPALRTQQTASALNLPFETLDAVAPNMSAHELLQVADWPNAKHAVLIIGHQPTLGEAAAFAMTGSFAMWSVKKSAVWWLNYRQRYGQAQTTLKTVINPEMLMV